MSMVILQKGDILRNLKGFLKDPLLEVDKTEIGYIVKVIIHGYTLILHVDLRSSYTHFGLDESVAYDITKGFDNYYKTDPSKKPKKVCSDLGVINELLMGEGIRADSINVSFVGSYTVFNMSVDRVSYIFSFPTKDLKRIPFENDWIVEKLRRTYVEQTEVITNLNNNKPPVNIKFEGVDEGDTCYRDGCIGEMILKPVYGCRCFTGCAPCAACMNQKPTCNVCGEFKDD